MMLQKCVLCLVLATINAIIPNGSFSGRWRLHGWLEGNSIESECNFIQNGSSLTGTCTSEQGTIEVSGQIRDANIFWSYIADYNGVTSAILYAGAFSAGKISGKITVNPDGADGAYGTNGRFTANPVR